MQLALKFLGSIMLVVCLSVTNAFAWSDIYPHAATTSGCTSHVSLPTQYIYTPSYTFNLCVAASGATQWKGIFLDGNNNPITACPGFGWTTNLAPKTTTCNVPMGTIKASITWKVGQSNEMNAVDNFYRAR
jgi:hypothetical protein